MSACLRNGRIIAPSSHHNRPSLYRSPQNILTAVERMLVLFQNSHCLMCIFPSMLRMQMLWEYLLCIGLYTKLRQRNLCEKWKGELWFNSLTIKNFDCYKTQQSLHAYRDKPYLKLLQVKWMFAFVKNHAISSNIDAICACIFLLHCFSFSSFIFYYRSL